MFHFFNPWKYQKIRGWKWVNGTNQILASFIIFPAGINLFKVNNGNTNQNNVRNLFKVKNKVNFKHISYIVSVFSLLTLNK